MLRKSVYVKYGDYIIVYLLSVYGLYKSVVYQSSSSSLSQRQEYREEINMGVSY